MKLTIVGSGAAAGGARMAMTLPLRTTILNPPTGIVRTFGSWGPLSFYAIPTKEVFSF